MKKPTLKPIVIVPPAAANEATRQTLARLEADLRENLRALQLLIDTYYARMDELSEVLSDLNDRTIEHIDGTQTAATGSWTGVTKADRLHDEMRILYRLPYAGSGNATLNLTLATGVQTGAKPVYRYGTTHLTTHYGAGALIPLTYLADTDAWYADADYSISTTYTGGYCTTGATTAAKAASFTYFALHPNEWIPVNFRYANTKKSAITLNINSTGAKPLYINGNPSSASNYSFPAGSYLIYYDGTNYYLRTDGLLPQAGV